jgi:hypothetical protein
MTWDALEHDAQSRKTFEKNGRNPQLWVAFADDLHRAAELLWSQAGQGTALEQIAALLSFGKTALMLDGFAVEMLAKAVIVRRNPNAVKDGQWFGPRKGHPLPELLQKIDFTLESPEEKDLVARLAAFASWAGRYPIPLDYSAATATHKDGKLELAPGTYLSSADRGPVADLIARLREQAVEP